MEKDVMFQEKTMIFFILGFLFVTTTESRTVQRCGLPCPNFNIPQNCIGKDFIVLDDELCQNCDLDLCLIKEWPPAVSVPFCPMENCQNLNIHPNCVLRQFRKINRRTVCRGCDIDVCKGPPVQTTTPSSPETSVHPLCPKLRCKLFGIPKDCLVPSYDIINGQKCRKCDEDACRHPPALRIPTKRKSTY